MMRCAYCFGTDMQLVPCTCGTQLHAECWVEHGRCVSIGCLAAGNGALVAGNMVLGAGNTVLVAGNGAPGARNGFWAAVFRFLGSWKHDSSRQRRAPSPRRAPSDSGRHITRFLNNPTYENLLNL